MASQQTDDILRTIELLRKEVAEHLPGDGDGGFKRKFLGGKSVFKSLAQAMRPLPVAERKPLGLALNQLRDDVKKRLEVMEQPLQKQHVVTEDYDVTLPPMVGVLGGLHPLTLMKEKVINILSKIGYRLADGPEIEPASIIFDHLNFPVDHPAIGMQDTFYIRQEEDAGTKMCLRSQTSSVQVYAMKLYKPPISVMSVGRVFRRETISSRSHCMFHQIEVLNVAEKITLSHLKGTLGYFVRMLFGEEASYRLRPSYFPFTEPSLEIDLKCPFPEEGCAFCKGGWIEIGGAGMVDPNVLKNCGANPKKYTGMAFGLGLERLAMIYYHIRDLRVFTENDARFSSQFTNFSSV